MSILWMTSLRPIGKSIENDEIQNLFVESLKNLKAEMTLSLTQFDDQGVQEYINKQNVKNYFVNFEKKNYLLVLNTQIRLCLKMQLINIWKMILNILFTQRQIF